MHAASLNPAGDRRTAVILVVVLASSFLIKLHDLGNPALTCFDESFHAIVARNLLDHPLEPTLVDAPYLPYDYRDWTANHVWLHKGILPLWQIALSYALLGVSTLALRLPSAILNTAAAGLTYLIGRHLLDRRAGLIAAALQAFNPALTMLVHGYWFSDHVDTALIFWVELGIYFLILANRTGQWRFILLAGVAQGLAFLCKYFLAGIILGLTITLWLLPLVRLGRRGRSKLRVAHIAGLLAATGATVAPWAIWCLHRFPQEFRYEMRFAARHLSESMEGWGAPWDRVVFDYLIQIYRDFYTPILVAAVVLLFLAIRRRQTGLWLIYAWALGTLIPHLFAESKTPSATAMAAPAFLLLLGGLISEACRGRRAALAAWAGVMAVSIVYPAVIRPTGMGYPDPGVFGGVMRGAPWVVGHVLAALAVVALGEAAARGRGSPGGASAADDAARIRRERIVRDRRRVLLALGVISMALLGYRTLGVTWAVVAGGVGDTNRRAYTEIGDFVRGRLPRNAALIVDDPSVAGYRVVQFYTGRTCYKLRPDRPGSTEETPNWLQDARQIARSGGVPYLVTGQELPLGAVFRSTAERLAIYECPP